MAHKIITLHPNAKDITGKVFGRLTAVAPIQNKPVKWLCICLCGTECTPAVSNLSNGHTQSCGCLQIERTSAATTTHGNRHTPEYNTYASMKSRCHNTKNKSYNLYGDRGIKVCFRWLLSFENFLNDMGPRPSPRHGIERHNNDGNYEPSNCSWELPHVQQNNKRSNVFLEFSGRRLTVSQWARVTGIKSATIRKRIGALEWSIKRSLTQHVRGAK